MKCIPCDDSLTNSWPRACPECPSAASSAAKETWSDEIIQVPNGDSCLSAEGEKCSPSQNTTSIPGKLRKQPKHINERSAQQTVVMCVPEVITENDVSQDPACESSYQHR